MNHGRWRIKLADNVIITGLCFNLVASFLMAYGRIFRSKETIKNESKTKGGTIRMKKPTG
jgi:hypothetical protein